MGKLGSTVRATVTSNANSPSLDITLALLG
ncbi:MAG: hypothetical protein K5Q00_02270 [Gammaproteobacteria bacterium]|nr:hypothetical protein [Gammaproteobacteria bacterium]